MLKTFKVELTIIVDDEEMDEATIGLHVNDLVDRSELALTIVNCNATEVDN